jgi:catechol 2,3-dioxygenase-like lactoylglutathione lyase family enzyme
MPPVLTHIAMQVRDVATSVAFYRDYCGMRVIHERMGGDVTWLAEPGRERELIVVLLAGGKAAPQADDDYGHLGFALGSREAVDAIAERARTQGCLVWPPRDEPYPVGYYCGVRDPDGKYVEFSYGQPLGPGAPDRPGDLHRS